MWYSKAKSLVIHFYYQEKPSKFYYQVNQTFDATGAKAELMWAPEAESTEHWGRCWVDKLPT